MKWVNFTMSNGMQGVFSFLPAARFDKQEMNAGDERDNRYSSKTITSP